MKESRYPHFMDEETEAQRDEAVCQKPQELVGQGEGMVPAAPEICL